MCFFRGWYLFFDFKTQNKGYFCGFFLILSLKNRGVGRKLNINFIKIVVINIEYPLFGNHLWHIDNSSLKEAKK